MPSAINSDRSIFPNTVTADPVPTTIASFNQLNAEDQLALIWFSYLEMGKTNTVATPKGVIMKFTESTLNQIQQMPFQKQTQVMFDLVNRADTLICRTYATWTPNIKLGFWYQIGQWMEQGTVALIPEDYQLSTKATTVLAMLKGLKPDQKTTVLRTAVEDMGFDLSKLDNSQPVSESVPPSKEISQQTEVNIEGITNQTVLSYMNYLNTNDFDGLIKLFMPNGALQPPFEKPIVGKDNLFQFFEEECQNLKLMPKQGVSEPAEKDGYTHINVIGQVQTPWFSAGVWINVAWRFLLNPENKISFVAVDLLASPRELLKLAP